MAWTVAVVRAASGRHRVVGGARGICTVGAPRVPHPISPWPWPPAYACHTPPAGAEIAYWLDEPYWGKKVITRVVHTLTGLAFAAQPSLNRIEAGILST
jgi:RimJ/RimL family protein N-acetyltransferase